MSHMHVSQCNTHKWVMTHAWVMSHHISHKAVEADMRCMSHIMSAAFMNVTLWVRHDSCHASTCMCVTWLMHVCDMTHACVWHDSWMRVTWLMHACDMTHACVWHDSCMRVTWLMHACDINHTWLMQDDVMPCMTMMSGVKSHTSSFWHDYHRINTWCISVI